MDRYTNLRLARAPMVDLSGQLSNLSISLDDLGAGPQRQNLGHPPSDVSGTENHSPDSDIDAVDLADESRHLNGAGHRQMNDD